MLDESGLQEIWTPPVTVEAKPAVVSLAGCRPRPLSSYLKAVAILRLVTLQKDPNARAYWHHDHFFLESKLDADRLVHFLLWEWQPSPIVAPWNKASGFFSSKDRALGDLENSKAERFAPIRHAISEARALLLAMDEAVQEFRRINEESKSIKDKGRREALRSDPAYKARLAAANRKCKKLKDELVPECQRRWRGGALEWLRTATVIHDGGEVKFPALLGTGGNDGKLEFTNNAYQRLNDLFEFDATGAPKSGSEDLLRATLFATPSPGLAAGAIGQFDPASGGGANASGGPLAPSLVNPWELLLLLEGSLPFVSGSTRRLLNQRAPLAAAPFAVRGISLGYGSASVADDGVRGEQWFPLWGRPWRLQELSAVLAEGRVQVSNRAGDQANELARSVGQLGVARGIESFERYGYLERNGKSNYATPLGRWLVQSRSFIELLDDVQPWVARIRRAVASDKAPDRVRQAYRDYQQCEFQVMAGGRWEHWRELMIRAARLEARLVLSGRFTAKHGLQPIPRLSYNWLKACRGEAAEDDVELRLALCLAGAGAVKVGARTEESQTDWGQFQLPYRSVRHHWLPLDSQGRFVFSESGAVNDPGVVMHGRAPVSDLIALVKRRLLDAETGAQRRLNLIARAGHEARFSDLLKLIRNELDLERIVWLSRALSAIGLAGRGFKDHDPPVAPSSYRALRLVFTAYPTIVAQRSSNSVFRGMGAERNIVADPSVVRLLEAGNGELALAAVLRRLNASGVQPPITLALVDDPKLWAASLAFPIGELQAGKLLYPWLKESKA